MEEGRLDPRVNAYRDDLADMRLKGKVQSGRFAEGSLKRVVAPSAPLKRVPRAEVPLDSEVLHGEVLRVFADTANGWSWVQSQTDSYVGFVPLDAVGPLGPEPTHRVIALRTFVYPRPDMKLPPVAALSLGSRIAVAGTNDASGSTYCLIAGGEQAVFAAHVEPVTAAPPADFVSVAERFLNVPYLWGGRTSLGLDCSALVQLSLMTAGIPAPRDTDMQMESLGTPVAGGVDAGLQRGDLIFWPGHVAIAFDERRIVHASGHHMAVVVEGASEAVARISKIKGRPRAVKRLARSGSPEAPSRP